MDLTVKTETELKALAYEQHLLINMHKNNLALVEAELARRHQIERTGYAAPVETPAQSEEA